MLFGRHSKPKDWFAAEKGSGFVAALISPQPPRYPVAASANPPADLGQDNIAMTRTIVTGLVIGVILLGLVGTARAADIVGPATAFDGDTLEVDGLVVSLYGIDAPELAQTCDHAGQSYRCGQVALDLLSGAIAGNTVVCERKGGGGSGRPVLAVCRLNGADIGGWLVSQGVALAYRKVSEDYLDEEEQARRFRKGLWGGGFTLPWVWRGEKP